MAITAFSMLSWNICVVGLALLLIVTVKIFRSAGAIGGRSIQLSWLYISVIFYLISTNLMETVILLTDVPEEYHILPDRVSRNQPS